MEKVQLLLTNNLSDPAGGPHIIIEAEEPSSAFDMAERSPFRYVLALDDEGEIPTTIPTA